ncbi:MAG: adenosylmethionine--8-amino-7-oxononanoate transaminase [Verrucomicrobiaceae bacterium]|nr:adenosylmethionine--8-amino-7-oxononanoate transaminase [Verrucomicrobiaceae bacterium]
MHYLKVTTSLQALPPVLRSCEELEKCHSWHPFTQMEDWCAAAHAPLMIEKAHGCVLRDQWGREYLDGNASIWTNIHGHNHPTINSAIAEQLGKVAHTSFLGLSHAPAAQLACELVNLLPGAKLERVFFSDDGSTAIECAVRMALQFWRQNGSPQRDTILAFDRAYHGDTLGAASLGGITMFKGSANQFGYQVTRIQSLVDLIHQNPERIAAVIIEPLVQGVAKMRLWPSGMLRVLHDWCVQKDVFLILDEVMTGFGRTGKMFACEHEGVVPDFLCLAKGLTGGYMPLAATMTTKRVFEGFLGSEKTFFYGHSYTANQLGCAAALGSLRVFREEHVLERLGPKIAFFSECLAELKMAPGVTEVRQLGLIAGIDIEGPEGTGAKICLAAREHGLLTRPIQNTIVLMPPLCVTLDELRQMVDAVRRCL